MKGLGWKVGLLAAVVLLFTYLSVGNFVSKEDRIQSDFWKDDGLRLGLDLQGGIHWVVGVEIDDAIQHELEFTRDGMRETLASEGVPESNVTVDGSELVFQVNTPAQAQAVRDAGGETFVLRESSASDSEIRYALTEAWTQEIRERTMAQVLEVLRRRINDPRTGIPESVVTRQGSDRVLVQIPGGQIDRGRARELLKSTGFLEFKIVLDRAGSPEELMGRYPDGLQAETELVTEKDPESDVVVAAYLVRSSADITGDYLDDARLNYDQQQRAVVDFRFNPEGGRLFGEITEANVGEMLAIILDKNVYSAPVIRGRITTQGQITGRFTPQEAANLAVVLRAGSLAVPVVIEEERTVGPTLGADSIRAGIKASMVGLALILVFAMAYYRGAGVYASLGLLVNISMLIGIMSLFEATLTLPGIAGLVLTVGMAVDANVIIFERIREELRQGKTPRAAIAAGFNRATLTVLDANVTTLITALILFEFGTGPIKGFAVTLSIGILTSVFSALVFTRALFMIYPGQRTVPQLSI